MGSVGAICGEVGEKRRTLKIDFVFIPTPRDSNFSQKLRRIKNAFFGGPKLILLPNMVQTQIPCTWQYLKGLKSFPVFSNYFRRKYFLSSFTGQLVVSSLLLYKLTQP